jgi:hypothetical protein
MPERSLTIGATLSQRHQAQQPSTVIRSRAFATRACGHQKSGNGGLHAATCAKPQRIERGDQVHESARSHHRHHRAQCALATDAPVGQCIGHHAVALSAYALHLTSQARARRLAMPFQPGGIAAHMALTENVNYGFGRDTRSHPACIDCRHTSGGTGKF